MPELSRWRRFTAALPMRTALTGVGVVWLLGCVWSFEEQTNFAAAKGFTLPWLLPLVIDGLAAAMAGVAYAASLDAQPAIQARLATALAGAARAGANAARGRGRAHREPGERPRAATPPSPREPLRTAGASSRTKPARTDELVAVSNGSSAADPLPGSAEPTRAAAVRTAPQPRAPLMLRSEAANSD